jgi:predicted HD phosphohydrolase
VLAALCHDIGKVIPTPNHSAIAAEMIEPFVSDDAYWMVKVHQDFEGDPLPRQDRCRPEVRLQHRDHPAYELAERFADEWDEKAFDPDYDMLLLEHVEPMVRSAAGPSAPSTGSRSLHTTIWRDRSRRPGPAGHARSHGTRRGELS